MPARKPPGFALRAARVAARRCQISQKFDCICKYSSRTGHLRPTLEPILRVRTQKANYARRNRTTEKSNQAARRIRRRSCRCNSNPIRCKFNARTDSATVREKPSAPQVRTRSRPRCSRLFIADSTAGCFCRANLKSSASSLSRSTRFSFPFFGRALRSSISFRSVERAVEPAIETTGSQFRILFLHVTDHRNRYIRVAAFP